MKTAKQIKAEIKSIQKEHKEIRFFSGAQLRKAGKRVSLLQKYVYYIQAGAKESNLKSDLAVLKKRLEIIETGYGRWLSHNSDYASLKNPKTKYKSEMGKAKVILQINALEYLLN